MCTSIQLPRSSRTEETVIDSSNNNLDQQPHGLLQLLLLMVTDILVCSATMALTIIAYRRAGACFNPYCYLRLWPLPFIYVAIAACCGLYRGTWPQTRPPWNPVLFLKAQFKAVLFTFLALSCYLVFTRVNLRYSRFILAFSWLLLIWLLPAARFAIRKIFHLPATQLDFNAKLPIHDGLLLPIPRLVKAIIEKIIAVLLLLLLSPLGIVLSLLVKLTSRGPIFYISERIGLRGKRFKVLKYRTMRHQADQQLVQLISSSPDIAQEWNKKFKLDNDPRITPLGRFLRKTSLDELPQLWNVIMGDMDIVGPRPIVDEEIPKYGNDYDEIVSVKPGITGLWQVSGRNDLPYEDRVRINLYYIRNWSIWLDYYILLKTPHEIFSAHGQ
ncbi:MAG: sugar transferase [Lentisphaeria bacterium]|nr:sugar transferase [Lentisphaeria bacterium]